MKDFARRGAEARITELNQELEAIYGAFPDLRLGRGRSGGLGSKLIKVEEAGARSARTGRRKMSAAQRKAVGDRMKKYWAAEAAAKKR